MIRIIDKKDKDIFIEMVSEFFSSPAVLHNIPIENIQNTFNELISDSPYTKAYIAEFNNEVAGYIMISITYSNEAGGIAILLEEIYIRDEFQNKGIGTELINFIKQEYPDAKRFRLEVESDNIGAVKLYKKLGFKKLPYMQMIIDK